MDSPVLSERESKGSRREFYNADTERGRGLARGKKNGLGEAEVPRRSDGTTQDAARSRDAREVSRHHRAIALAHAIARQRAERRAARHAVPARRMDDSPGRAPRAREPHARLYKDEAGGHRGHA